MKTLVWLASFPKSGNTWLRIFLANYLVNGTEPVPLNQLERYGTGDQLIRLYRKSLGQKAPNPFDDKATVRAREAAFRPLATNGADVNFIKTHNRNAMVLSARLIPVSLTKRAFYIIRDPQDVVVSYADHYDLTLEQAVAQLSNPGNTILPNETAARQFLGSWSEHVLSWTSKTRFPVSIIRYEDMIADPLGTFGQVVADLGAPEEPARLERAVAHSSFESVSAQESKTGFIEKSPASTKFFRSGKIGEGRRTLPESLIDRLCSDHANVMKKFGYI